jgi:hypothetical protein
MRPRSAQAVIRKVVIDSKEPVYFDLETVSLLRETLDDAWA